MISDSTPFRNYSEKKNTMIHLLQTDSDSDKSGNHTGNVGWVERSVTHRLTET